MRPLIATTLAASLVAATACAPQRSNTAASATEGVPTEEQEPPPIGHPDTVMDVEPTRSPELFSFAHGFLLHDDADVRLKECVLRSWAGFIDCIIEIRTSTFDAGSACNASRDGLNQSKILVAPACGWGLATYRANEGKLSATVRCRLELVGVMHEDDPLPHNLVLPTPPIYKPCGEEVRKSEFLMRWQARQ